MQYSLVQQETDAVDDREKSPGASHEIGHKELWSLWASCSLFFSEDTSGSHLSGAFCPKEDTFSFALFQSHKIVPISSPRQSLPPIVLLTPSLLLYLIPSDSDP